MKNTFIFSVLVAALMTGQAFAVKDVLNASEYVNGSVVLTNVGSSDNMYEKLVLDQPLVITNYNASLDLRDGATIEFQVKDDGLCDIGPSPEEVQHTLFLSNFKEDQKAIYNFLFNDKAQQLIVSTPSFQHTLISTNEAGMHFMNFITPEDTIIKLNGANYGETVELGGVSFTYVGPKPDDYVFMNGEIGLTGYYESSRGLKLVVGPSVPEPTTGTLSLLALAALAARRRRK